MGTSPEAVSVSCNHCGAPLDVPAGTRFVTCAHCGSRLEVRRSSGAYYTEVLESIGQTTQQIAREVETIRRQNELEQLDREWMMRREALLVRGKDGKVSAPSSVGSVMGGVFAVVVGIVWMSITASAGAPWFFPLFGLLFIGAGIAGALVGTTKAGEYERAETEYTARREALLRNDAGKKG